MTTERDALTKVRDWLADSQMETWPYMENGPFYEDRAEMLVMLNAALAGRDAAPPAPQGERPQPEWAEYMQYPEWRANRDSPSADAPTREWVNRLAAQYAVRQIATLRNDRPAIAAANHWIGLIAQEHIFDILQTIRAGHAARGDEARECRNCPRERCHAEERCIANDDAAIAAMTKREEE